ncbi:T9SS C-terminal target domain-containing protein [Crocinitomix catalasitica]|uniref:T9SS C-terminal target domain-containing protein n=1 Tax=Crocinitomix catalasitica TaxID=184607 RepID=UPI000484A30C|nr:T9SS C-terminal target domain-containing protein [Crocinitomix catalasitica]
MKATKFLILICLISYSFNGWTQEICDNGIDDDGDGLVDLNDVEDCECTGLIETSFIPNPSFEDSLCCPYRPGMLNCADAWTDVGSADYYTNCEDFGVQPPPAFPLPGDGFGYVGIGANFSPSPLAVSTEYIGACLDSPLLSGSTYVLNFYTAYSRGFLDLDLTVYGATSCVDLAWYGDCPEGLLSWEILSEVLVTYPEDRSWIEVTMTITPDEDIAAIALCWPCTAEYGSSYYYFDEFVLVDSTSFFILEESGGWCTGDLILSCVGDEPGGTCQWYKNGIALIGETEDVLDPIPYGEGLYSVVYSNESYCIRNDYISPGIFDVNFDYELSGCFPTSVNFSNLTDSIHWGPVSWQWSFGDGFFSEDKELTYEYIDPGVYEVILIGISTDESCSDTASYEIIVYDNPNAEYEIESETTFLFWGSIASCTKQELQFNDLSTSDPLAPITIWHWDFGDGTTSDEENPVHIYVGIGTYRTKLYVENEFGCRDSFRLSIYITALNPEFTVINNCVFEELIFTNESEPSADLTVDSYEWLFGDGSTSDLEDPTHAYLDEGIYTVELIAISESGCRDTMRHEITPYPSPDVGIEFIVTGISSEDGGTGGCIYNPVEFYDHSSIDDPYTIVSWNWDFGDGATSTDENPVHDYDAPGLYTVSLTTESDLGCEANGTIDILMVDGIAIVSPDTTICQNGTATVYAQSSDGSPHDYTWSIPGSDESRIQTIPAADAPIKIYVYATDPAGCVSPMDSIYVDVLPPFTGDLTIPIHTCAGDDMNGSVIPIGGDGAYNYSWTANGLSLPVNAPTITHNPFTTTEYCVTISDGCETTPLTLCATTYVALIPAFTSDKTFGCIGTAVEFTSLSEPVDSILEYEWVIEGERYSGPSAAHVFETEGRYTIKLNVLTIDGCWTSFSVNNYIIIYGLPTPEFYITPNPATVLNSQVELVNISPNPYSSFQWRMPRGAPDYAENDSLVTVIYPPEVNNHWVTMIETTEFGCIDSTLLTVFIEREHILYAPNAFTPDGDTRNNTWQVYVDGLDVYDFHLTIFNRYGEKVWETYDVSKAWDGRYGNQGIVQDGTYVWIIEAKDLSTDKHFRFEGMVNVLK